MNASVPIAVVSVSVMLLARLLMGGLALQGTPLFPMFFALGTRQARQYFRLVCPPCGHSRPQGGNFLFSKAICKRCKTARD